MSWEALEKQKEQAEPEAVGEHGESGGERVDVSSGRLSPRDQPGARGSLELEIDLWRPAPRDYLDLFLPPFGCLQRPIFL